MQPFLFQQRLENNCRQCQMAHEINAQQGKPTKVAKYNEMVGLLRGLLMKKTVSYTHLSHDSNLDMVRAEAALKRSLARIKAAN